MSETIGQRIKAARKARGLTQKQVAERANCTMTAISRYEQGQRHDYNMICRIAGAIGCPLSELTGEAEQSPLSAKIMCKYGIARVELFDDHLEISTMSGCRVKIANGMPELEMRAKTIPSYRETIHCDGHVKLRTPIESEGTK